MENNEKRPPRLLAQPGIEYPAYDEHITEDCVKAYGTASEEITSVYGKCYAREGDIPDPHNPATEYTGQVLGDGYSWNFNDECIPAITGDEAINYLAVWAEPSDGGDYSRDIVRFIYAGTSKLAPDDAPASTAARQADCATSPIPAKYVLRLKNPLPGLTPMFEIQNVVVDYEPTSEVNVPRWSSVRSSSSQALIVQVTESEDGTRKARAHLTTTTSSGVNRIVWESDEWDFAAPNVLRCCEGAAPDLSAHPYNP